MNMPMFQVVTPAALAGRFEIVQVLLEAGADRSVRDSQNMTAEDYARRDQPAVWNLLQGYVRVVQTADEVIFSRPLSNRTLEEVFNFVSMERISLVRNGKYGPVEAITRDSFSVIEDEAALRKAFEEHVKRGGTADESAVFPNRLQKKKLPRAD